MGRHHLRSDPHPTFTNGDKPRPLDKGPDRHRDRTRRSPPSGGDSLEFVKLGQLVRVHASPVDCRALRISLREARQYGTFGRGTGPAASTQWGGESSDQPSKGRSDVNPRTANGTSRRWPRRLPRGRPGIAVGGSRGHQSPRRASGDELLVVPSPHRSGGTVPARSTSSPIWPSTFAKRRRPPLCQWIRISSSRYERLKYSRHSGWWRQVGKRIC